MSSPLVDLSTALESAEVFVDGDWVESKDQDPDGDVRLIQLADVGDGVYIDKSCRFLTAAKARALKCTLLKEGDVLVARMPDPLGRACIFPGDVKTAVTVVDVCIIRPRNDTHDPRWLMYTLNTPSCRQQIAGFAKAALDAELERLRAEIAVIKKQNAETPDTHNYSEAETRDYFIDLLLKEAGWPLDKTQDREYPVTGMPNEKGEGFVDYVLWGDDGKPLGLVEAKRTKRDARVGQQQAKLYADCLEKQFGQRPIIFYSNGYEHWIWDDRNYPPRSVQGFYAKDELERLIQRRTTRTSLGATEINKGIVERFYQERAIRRIGEAFEKDHDRKALVVMATGAGKTRTVVALCDLMMRCNWVKRVLFLADRIALVKQTTRVFTRFLPSASAVNAMENPEQITDARVLVSTYPTMLRLIDETKDGRRRFGPGHFDLVVIDEAHRSVYQKYRAIFEYFDSFLVGLTATTLMAWRRRCATSFSSRQERFRCR